jgi:hypothetical protein
MPFLVDRLGELGFSLISSRLCFLMHARELLLQGERRARPCFGSLAAALLRGIWIEVEGPAKGEVY